MPSAVFPSLFFTVILLVATAYFLLGGLPLLILKHDTPMDARFVRGFFNVYYKADFYAALGAALSYGLWGRIAFAAGAAGLALVAVLLRKNLIAAMQDLGARIAQDDGSAISGFRKMHVAALLVNLAQLVVLVWSLTKLSV